MDEDEKWNNLIRSIKKAAKILNIDMTEPDLPEYMNWFVARKIHRYLWNLVYLKRWGNKK